MLVLIGLFSCQAQAELWTRADGHEPNLEEAKIVLDIEGDLDGPSVQTCTLPCRFYPFTIWSGLQPGFRYGVEFVLTDPSGETYISPRSASGYPTGGETVATRDPGNYSFYKMVGNRVSLYGRMEVSYAWSLFELPDSAPEGTWTAEINLGRINGAEMQPVWEQKIKVLPEE